MPEAGAVILGNVGPRSGRGDPGKMLVPGGGGDPGKCWFPKRARLPLENVGPRGGSSLDWEVIRWVLEWFAAGNRGPHGRCRPYLR